MKKVLVALSSNSIAARESMIGVFQFVNSGHAWNIHLLENVQSMTERLVMETVRNGTDGIITGFSEVTDGYLSLMKSRIPVALVNFPDACPPSADRGAIILHNDEELIGGTGAKFLRSKGSFNSFAFVPTRTRTYWSTFREHGFAEETAKWKVTRRFYRWEGGPLGEWLGSLPKPAAVMAASDNVAVSVIAECGRMKLSVPEQVAVLGVDNDELYCNSSRPTLSSIHPNHLEMGRRAAEELDRVMNGKKPPAHPIYIPPIQVVERDSTRSVPPAGFLINSALMFIRENFGSGITVSDVVRHTGVSERLLRLRFSEIIGKSVRDTLLETRLEAAKKSLTENAEPISRIAGKCGFSSLARFTHFFTERTGMSPMRFREEFRSGKRHP